MRDVRAFAVLLLSWGLGPSACDEHRDDKGPAASSASPPAASGAPAGSASESESESAAARAASPSESAAARAANASESAAAPSASGSPSESAHAGDPPLACPPDMALVLGAFCPVSSQPCLEKPKVLGGPGHLPCQRYAEARCLSKTRTAMRYCMDRYEWPNQKGELPRTLTSWPEAARFCVSAGKRLCTADEFTFACEGESMRAHVYGNERSAEICNADRPYIARTYDYEPWDACHKKPACKAELARLDQRLPAGAKPECVSEHGVFDLNGNVNEWVVRTDQKSPHRSGLKGGWWGPVRNRCRPMTTFHLEGDYGYEQGFRCCKAAG